MSASSSEIVRSTFGFSPSAPASGDWRDRIAGGGAPVPIGRSAGAEAAFDAGAVAVAACKGSGGVKVRIVFGKTVLLKRSLLGFSMGAGGGCGGVLSAAAGKSRAFALLRRSTKGIVMRLVVFCRHAPDFFQRGDAFERFFHAHHAQGFHPLADSLILDDRGRGTLDDETANRLAYRQRLDERYSPEITALLAPAAARAVIKHSSLAFLEA